MVFQKRLQSLLGSDSNGEAQTTLEISNSSLQKHNATSAFRETRRHGLNAEGTSQRSDPKKRRLCGAETLASHRSAGNRPYPGCCSPSLGEHSLSTLLWECRPLSGPAAERGKVSGGCRDRGARGDAPRPQRSAARFSQRCSPRFSGAMVLGHTLGVKRKSTVPLGHRKLVTPPLRLFGSGGWKFSLPKLGVTCTL